jgi:2,3-dihydroxyphenylpropionate 1,2-dioxygenase
MARIIAGVAMSHSPMIMTNEAGGGEKGQRFLNTAATMKNYLEESGADVIVLVSDDHLASAKAGETGSFQNTKSPCSRN